MTSNPKAKSSVDFSRELYLACVEVGNMRGVPVGDGDDYFSWFRKFAMVFTMKDIKEHERIFGSKVEGAFGEIVRIVKDRKQQLIEESKSTSIA
jgi:hypothetical protein